VRLRGPTRAFLLAAVIGAATMGACSLNPQPIPPGEQADSGSDFGGSGGTSDAAGLQNSDAGTTGPVPDEDAGDAATDGGDQDASDADTDANDE